MLLDGIGWIKLGNSCKQLILSLVPMSVDPTLRKVKIQNVRVWSEEVFIDEKARTEKVGNLMVPRIHL